jgi:hypothetical protein
MVGVELDVSRDLWEVLVGRLADGPPEEGFEVGEVVVPQRVSFRSSRFASAGSTLDNGSR